MYGDRLSRFLGLVRVILGQRNALKEWSSIERGGCLRTGRGGMSAHA